MDLTNVAKNKVFIPEEINRLTLADTEELVVYVVSENDNIVTPDIGEYYDELALGSTVTRRGNEFVVLAGFIYNYEDDSHIEEERNVFKMKSVYTFTLTPKQSETYGYRFSPIEELKGNAGFMEELNGSN